MAERIQEGQLGERLERAGMGNMDSAGEMLQEVWGTEMGCLSEGNVESRRFDLKYQCHVIG